MAFGPRWHERQPAVLHTLRAVAPDVVGLQEAWGAGGTSQAHELAERLGMHPALSTGCTPPTTSRSSAT